MNSSSAVKTIYPNRIRFMCAFFIYCFSILIPFILVVWFLKRGVPTDSLLVAFFLALLISFTSYPYYAVSKDAETVTGATLWGWLQRREEIRFSEIDQEKVFGQRLGRQLGIVILSSRQGKKILTLGLNDQQLLELLNTTTLQS